MIDYEYVLIGTQYDMCMGGSLSMELDSPSVYEDFE